MKILSRKSWWVYLSLFVLALAVRLMFFFLFLYDNPCALMYDAGHYHEVALSLLAGKGYTNAAGAAYFYRLPGYPLFLAGCYALVGQALTPVLLLHVAVAALIPSLVALLAWRLFSSLPVAWIAGLLAVVHPGLLIFSGLVMSETLFLLFFIGFLLFFLPLFVRQGIAYRRLLACHLFAAGVLLGLASLVRPVGHLLLPLVGSALLFLPISWAGRVRAAFAGLSGWLLMVAPWLIRNALLTGYLFFHTLPGVHFLNHAATRVYAVVHGLSYEQAKSVMQVELARDEAAAVRLAGGPLQEIEHCVIAQNLANRICAEHPVATVRLALLNMFKTVFGLYSSELLMIDSAGYLPPYDAETGLWARACRLLVPQVKKGLIGLVIYAELIFMFVLYASSLVFSYCAFRQRRWRSLLAVMFGLGFFFIAISAACGFARLRLAIEPLLMVAGGYVLQDWWQRFGRLASMAWER